MFEKAINNPAMTVTVESLSPDEMPVTITLPEFMRRMKDMAASGGGGFAMMGQLPEQYSVAVNANHSLTGKILKAEGEEQQTQLAKQAVDLAKLSQNMLTGADLTHFIERSVEMVTE